MNNVTDLASLIASPAQGLKLVRRGEIPEAGWTFWELRTWNIHRVVGLWNAGREFPNAPGLVRDVRAVVERNFKTSFWRGMGYGVVIDLSAITMNADELKHLVDGRANPKGTLQWMVLVASEAKTAVGVHMWTVGYLTPLYRAITDQLGRNGYRVATGIAEKDGLMRFLTAVADAEAAVATLGMRRKVFPEYRDPPPSSGA